MIGRCTGSGRLGLGKKEWWRISATAGKERLPRVVSALGDMRIVAASAGHAHSAVVDEGGGVWAFGYGRFFQLGNGAADRWIMIVEYE